MPACDRTRPKYQDNPILVTSFFQPKEVSTRIKLHARCALSAREPRFCDFSAPRPRLAARLACACSPALRGPCPCAARAPDDRCAAVPRAPNSRLRSLRSLREHARQHLPQVARRYLQVATGITTAIQQTFSRLHITVSVGLAFQRYSFSLPLELSAVQLLQCLHSLTCVTSFTRATSLVTVPPSLPFLGSNVYLGRARHGRAPRAFVTSSDNLQRFFRLSSLLYHQGAVVA